jgi:hypothetical protein
MMITPSDKKSTLSFQKLVMLSNRFAAIVASLGIATSAMSATAAPVKVQGTRTGYCTRGGFFLNQTTSCLFPRLENGQNRFSNYYTNLRSVRYQSGVGATVRVYTPTMRELFSCRIDRTTPECDLSHQGDGHLEVYPYQTGTTNFTVRGR